MNLDKEKTDFSIKHYDFQKWRETTEEIRMLNALDNNYDETKFSLNKFIAKIGIFVVIGAFLLGLII